MAQCPLCVPAHSRLMVQLASQGQQGRISGSGSVAQVILLYSQLCCGCPPEGHVKLSLKIDPDVEIDESRHAQGG